MKITPDRTPVNKQAALMTSKGVAAPMPKASEHFRADAPPEMIKTIPRKLLENPSWENLTGFKFGRFEVVGLLRSKLSRWVVRCSCGVYEVRKAKSVRSQRNSEDRCAVCRNFAWGSRSKEERSEVK